jgi:hypothetical protein
MRDRSEVITAGACAKARNGLAARAAPPPKAAPCRTKPRRVSTYRVPMTISPRAVPTF